MNLRWDPCIVQSGNVLRHFLQEFLDHPKRLSFVIGGAGFDPRAILVPECLSSFKKGRVQGIFFREERLNPQRTLRERADGHQKRIQELLPGSKFPEIQVFAEGKTVVGGRRAVEVLRSENVAKATDILIDISALSTNVFFPVVRACLLLCDNAQKSGETINLHLFAAEEPSFDHQIRGMPCDAVTWLHGYRGGESLEASHEKALLWLPTLAPGNVAVSVLNRIHGFISRPLTPIDVCPIIPFPSHDPRMPDKLVVEYREALAQWKTDTRNFLYAAESDPLDCYRTICSICSERERIFKHLAGSIVVLSPVGNKLLAVGAMLAAIERDLPVAMVEAVGYDADVGSIEVAQCGYNHLNHIWLAGEAYLGRKRINSTMNKAL